MLGSQLQSLGLAFVAILLMMTALLRSLKLGLFSMIPNFAPVLLGLAFMGVAGISLDAGTVMIGCVALGLVVDDTVYFLVRLRRRLATGEGIEDAVAGAMGDTGRAIVLTSVLLAAGFGVLAFGSFAPTTFFGVVSALVVILALVADLVVLPAALLAFWPRGRG